MLRKFIYIEQIDLCMHKYITCICVYFEISIFKIHHIFVGIYFSGCIKIHAYMYRYATYIVNTFIFSSLVFFLFTIRYFDIFVVCFVFVNF